MKYFKYWLVLPRRPTLQNVRQSKLLRMKRKLVQFVKTICARDSVKMVSNQPNQHKFSVSKNQAENLNGTESLEAAKDRVKISNFGENVKKLWILIRI